MYTIWPSRRYQRSYHRLHRSGKQKNIKILERIINTLAAGQELKPSQHDHALIGRMTGYRECPIKPDLLLIYSKSEARRLLILADLGSHSELFD